MPVDQVKVNDINIQLDRLTLQAEAIKWELEYIKQRFQILQTAAREVQDRAAALTVERERLVKGNADTEKG